VDDERVDRMQDEISELKQMIRQLLEDQKTLKNETYKAYNQLRDAVNQKANI